MAYDIVDVCKRMLDNADLTTYDLSGYPAIRLHFIVAGSVDEKFWEVDFACDRTISLNFHSYHDLESYSTSIVLDTSVVETTMEELRPEVAERIDGAAVYEKIWVVKVWGGDVDIQIVCLDFTWNLKELSHSEYKAVYDRLRGL